MSKPVRVDTLAHATPAGSASGGGWHQDAARSGFKALMYLDDVDEESGPFAMLIGYDGAAMRPNGDRRRTRYDEAEIESHVRAGAHVRARRSQPRLQRCPPCAPDAPGKL